MTDMTERVQETVTRHEITGPDWEVEPSKDGEWVRFTDYEALAARLAEVEANQHRLECENTERLRERLAAEAERDRLAAELAEARSPEVLATDATVQAMLAEATAPAETLALEITTTTSLARAQELARQIMELK